METSRDQIRGQMMAHLPRLRRFALALTGRSVEADDLVQDTVERAIRLIVRPPAEDFSSIVAGAETLTGNYEETITLKGLGSNSREYRVSGGFTLNRISPVPTLTVAP